MISSKGAFTFMDTKTGEVRAIGSGRGENKAVFKGHNMAIELDRCSWFNYEANL
ncbi:hypothetical protein ACT7DH_10590 [Bacillus pacificus]